MSRLRRQKPKKLLVDQLYVVVMVAVEVLGWNLAEAMLVRIPSEEATTSRAAIRPQVTAGLH